MFLPNHILKPSGNAMPGLVPEVLFAPKAHFLTIAAPPTEETTPGADVIITGNHVFTDPDLGFIKIELTENTAFLTATQQGEIDSESTLVVFEGFSSGINPALLSFMGKQFQGIVLARDASCAADEYYQLGSNCSLTYKKGFEFTTGTKGGDGRKGMKVRFEATMDKLTLYRGAVTLATQPSQS